MISTTYNTELAFAKNLAKEAGAIMRKYFRNDQLLVETKSDKTLVTVADTEINTLVIDRVSETFPEHSVWGEEEKVIKSDSKFTWVCDPIDGTVPFAKGLPISTFSLALVDENGVSVVGVVYDPYLDRLFEAVRGEGAYLGDRRLQVSDKESLDRAFIDNELWINHEEQVNFIDPRDMLARAGATVMSQCSMAITGCLVAGGQFDGVLFGQGKPEDIAALSVIVEEAGGKVTDLFGNPQRYDTNILGAIVSNGYLHQELVDVVAKIKYSSKYIG